MKKRLGMILALMLALPLAGWALGPHEILILVNTNSTVSVSVGETYARLRHVPDVNVIRVGVSTGSVMTVQAFKETIYNPVLKESKRRGVDGHILAWVYAPGFPWRIEGNPALSLTGITFVRGEVQTNVVATGQWLSPYFAGPDSPGEPGYGSRSLDVLANWLGDERPIAAWALSHVGQHGLTFDETGSMLIRGMDSDCTRPEGTIYFVTNADIRSVTREWEIPAAIEELSRLGARAVITNEIPRGVNPVNGLFIGSASFDIQGVRFTAGALADHLTSFGAVFDNGEQTKCTIWLSAGAAAAGGTVTEPFAFWAKFPNARLFVHYVAGCTALESYYQSIRQPLQYLPLGDPLAAPWKPRAEVTVEGLDEAIAGKGRGLRFGIKGGNAIFWSTYRVFVDGREAGGGLLDDPYPWKPDMWASGVHELRVVVYSGGLLRHQVYATRSFTLVTREAP
jgi:hypothetical protein